MLESSAELSLLSCLLQEEGVLRVVLWWGSHVEPASGACLKKPFSSLSLVVVGSQHHPSTPACPL